MSHPLLQERAGVRSPEGFRGDCLEDRGGIGKDLLVWKAKQGVTQRLKIRIAVYVVSGLVPHLMHTTVELHDQLQLEATEIRDEDRDRELAAELQSIEAPVAHELPERTLSWSLLSAESTYGRPHTLAHSLERGR